MSLKRVTNAIEVMPSQPMQKCDLDLGAKVVDEVTKYAQSLGFKPHRDARQALKVLGDANSQNCTETVPLGGEVGQEREGSRGT